MKKIVNGAAVDASAADLEQRAADEAAWEARAAVRAAEEAERRFGKGRADRDIAIGALAAGHPHRVAAEAVEALWRASGVRGA